MSSEKRYELKRDLTALGAFAIVVEIGRAHV